MKKVVLTFLTLVLAILIPCGAYVIRDNDNDNDSENFLLGSGTKYDPYVISSAEDLMLFRDLVNSGETFEGRTIIQTCDIDLKDTGNWTPIGVNGKGTYFEGTYNGCGYTIKNLEASTNNAGFFGKLEGTVINLGIQSGKIKGSYVGSIASCGSGAIINCYNKAEIIGEGRAGGIADNFSGGTIFACYNAGSVEAPISGGICSYNAEEIYYCVSFNNNLVTDTFVGLLTDSVEYSEVSQDAVKLLNSGLSVVREMDICRGRLTRYYYHNEKILHNKFDYKEEYLKQWCKFIIVISAFYILVFISILIWKWLNNPKIVLQLFSIYGLLILFLISWMISAYPRYNDFYILTLWTIGIIVPFLILFVAMWSHLRYFKKRIRTLLLDGSNLLSIAVIIVFVLATRVPFIKGVQLVDECNYYHSLIRACQNFDGTFSSFLDNFVFSAHPVYAVGPIWAIGEFLFPGKAIGVTLVHLVFTAVVAVDMYFLFCDFLRSKSCAVAALATMCCLSVPIFWTMFAYITPEYLLAVFMFLVVYNHYKENYLLMFFWGIAACFTKETGMILMFCYYATCVFVLFAKSKGNIIDKAKHTVFNKAILGGILTGVVLVGYFIVNRGVSSWKPGGSGGSSSIFTWSVSPYRSDVFGYNLDNILTHIKEGFVVNFSWIGVLVILTAVVVKWIKKEHILQDSTNKKPIYSLIGALTGYMLLMMVLVTAPLMRYNAFFSFMMCMLICLALEFIVLTVIKRKTIGKVVLSGLLIAGTLLVSTQTFYAVDPVTNLLYEPIDVGNKEILCFSWSLDKRPWYDYYITTLGYRSIGESQKALLTEVNYNENDIIMVGGNTYEEAYENWRNYLWSTAATSTPGARFTRLWNTETKSFEHPNVLNKDNPDLVDINTFTTYSLFGLSYMPAKNELYPMRNTINKTANKTSRYILYISPLVQGLDEDALLESLSPYYLISERKSVEADGFVLPYYELYAKILVDGLSENDVFLRTMIDNEALLEEVVPLMSNPYSYEELIDILKERVTDDEVHQALISDMTKFSTEYLDRTTVQEGDSIAVIIETYDEDGDYIANEVSMTGTTVRNIVIGTGAMVDGIEKALIGAEVGETVEVICDFPDDYQSNLYADKTCTLKIEITGINSGFSESQDIVLQKLLNKAATNNEEIETLKDYEDYLREKIAEEYITEDEFVVYATNRSEVRPSAERIEKHSSSLYEMIEKRAEAMGITVKSYIQEYLELSEEELEAYSEEYALYRAKRDLMFGK